jgi:Fe-S cluster assembly protein SufD
MTSFLETLASERARVCGTEVPAWLKSLRDTAWQEAAAAGLPTTRHESWKFTSLRPLGALTAKLPEKSPWELLSDEVVNKLREILDPNGLNLIFVDGVFAHELSGAGHDVAEDARLHDFVHVEDLATALRGPSSDSVRGLIDAMRVAKSALPVPLAHVAPQEQTIENLTNAHLDHGIVIRVAAGAPVPAPVRLIHVSTGKSTAAFTHHLVCIGASATARVTEYHLEVINDALAGDAVAGSHFCTTDIHLSANSRLRYDRILARPRDFNFGATNAIVPAGATCHSLAINVAARIGRHNITAMVTGEGAEVILDGLTTTRGDEVLDTQSAIDHRVPHTTSRQLYKGILKDKSRSVFSGKIFVRKDAQKTAAFQQSRNLLLSSDAEVDAKPQLEIEADDVRCSHGATVAQLSPDEMFYLQSRGIPRPKAEAMLCDAFSAEIWQTANDPWLEKQIKAALARHFQ